MYFDLFISDYRSLVGAFCLFCRESVNRAKIREGGGLQDLLNILKNDENKTLHPTVIHGLLNFLYDELSIKILLDQGLVSVLTKHLKSYVEENGKVHYLTDNEKKPEISDASDSGNTGDLGRESQSEVSEKLTDSSQEDIDNISSRGRRLSAKTFRVNSPSYQAVRCEYGEGAPQWFSFSSSYRDDWSPGSPNSMCISPGSSPPSFGTKSSPCVALSGWNWHLSSTSRNSESSPGLSSPRSYMSESIEEEDGPYSPVYDDDDDEEAEENVNDDTRPKEEDVVCDSLKEDVSTKLNINVTRIRELGKRTNVELFPSCPDYESSTPKKMRYNSEKEEMSLEDIVDESFDVPSPSETPEKFADRDDELEERIDKNMKPEERKIHNVLWLLSRVSHMDFPIEDMASTDTIQTLLDYLVLIRKPIPRAGRVLTRIVR